MDMAMVHLKVNNIEKIASEKKSKVQLLPFKLHADCEANVDKYFNNFVQTAENGQLTASFRGYPLQGQTINLPSGYKGVQFHESKCAKKERTFYAINTFDSITYWNWSKTPSKNDGIVQAMDWVDIAEALHSPINEE